MNASNPYFLLVVMHATGVMAFILDHRGHGRVEEQKGLTGAVLMLVTWPLLLFSTLGIVGNTLWAAFSISIWRVIGLALLVHIVWGSTCSLIMGYIRVNGFEHVLHALGIPLVFALRLASTVAAIALFLGLWHGFA